MEMKRPEAQKAVSTYIQQNCEIDLYTYETKSLGNALKDPEHASVQLHNLRCFYVMK